MINRKKKVLRNDNKGEIIYKRTAKEREKKKKTGMNNLLLIFCWFFFLLPSFHGPIKNGNKLLRKKKVF